MYIQVFFFARFSTYIFHDSNPPGLLINNTPRSQKLDFVVNQLFILQIFSFMIDVFTHESICPECPFKSNQRKREIFDFDSAVCSAVWHIDSAVHGMHTTESNLAHRGDWLSGVMDTAEIDLAVGCTPQSFSSSKLEYLTPLWDAHCRDRLSGGMHTEEIDKWLCGVMYTAGIYKRCDPPHGDWLRSSGVMNVGIDLTIFKILISWRNRKRILKYFSLFISGPDGFESRKKLTSKILWHTPF